MRKLSLASKSFAAVALVVAGVGVVVVLRSRTRRMVSTASLALPLPEFSDFDVDARLCDGPVRRPLRSPPPAALEVDEEAAGPPPGPLRVLESHGDCGAYVGLQSGRLGVATAVLRSICDAPELPAISFSHVILAPSSGHWYAEGIVRSDGTFFLRWGQSAASVGHHDCHSFGRYDPAQLGRAAAWLRARGWASVGSERTGASDVRSRDGYAYLDVMSALFGREAVRLSILDGS